MDEAPVAKRDPDVGGAAAYRFEEQQVPRLHVIKVDRLPALVLTAYLTRDRGAVLREHILHEAAAIEARGIVPPVTVGGAEKLECRLDDPVGRVRCLRRPRWQRCL